MTSNADFKGTQLLT